ncbi:MAG TPA: T9SS type A sorting domain-containing protein, partial [Rubricoccaceae bacterium]
PAGPVYALGQDTLITYRGSLVRSVNNGATFQSVIDNGVGSIGHFFEVPSGTTGAGVLLGGQLVGWAGYSHDRGASWHLSAPPSPRSDGTRARRFAVVTDGPRAGRIVGAGFWGIATSDDRGISFQRVQGYYEPARFLSEAIGALRGAAPGGGDRLVAAIIDPTRPGIVSHVIVSDDGGDSWRETFGLTGDPNAVASEVVDMGGGRAVIAMNGGHIWATADAGETWAIVGVVPGSLIDQGPAPTSNARVLWALRGPDGRLYVGGSRLGGRNPGWAFRTVAPFVAGEAGPGAAPGVGVAVRPNPASGRAEVAITLAEAGPVRVAVVDALGREVAVVLAGEAPAGERTVGVDVSAWPVGVYVVRASAGTRTATARLVVAR